MTSGVDYCMRRGPRCRPTLTLVMQMAALNGLRLGLRVADACWRSLRPGSSVATERPGRRRHVKRRYCTGSAGNLQQLGDTVTARSARGGRRGGRRRRHPAARRRCPGRWSDGDARPIEARRTGPYSPHPAQRRHRAEPRSAGRRLRQRGRTNRRQKILAVGRNLNAAVPVVDAAGMIVMPGFVDTHHHQYETILRGILADGVLGTPGDGKKTYQGVIQGIFTPVYQPEDAYISQLVASLSQLNSGVTTTVDTSRCRTRRHTATLA